MKTIGIIRNRGQLTIPDQVREQVPWATPLSAVSISVTTAHEIVIRPVRPATDWKKIKKNIKTARSLTGASNTNTAQFLEKDRQR